MLKIIDKYIIRKFLSTFFFMLGLIMLFAVVFDLSDKLSEFISHKAPFSAIVLEYYLGFIIFHGNMFSSMIIFISVIWFTAKMAQDTEIIPMWFSGRPINRFLRPYMIASTILMILSLIINHLIVPRTNKLRLGFEEKYYRDVMMVEDYHAEYPGNRIVYFSNYSNQEDEVKDLVVQQWNDSSQPYSFLKARKAKNIRGTNKWVLTDVYEKRLGFPKGTLTHYAKKDTVFDFQINEMAQRENIAETMTYIELTGMIKREKYKGSAFVPFYEIELYQRTSYPFATYILTIIGVAVSSKKKRGGVGVNIAIGLAFVFIYIFCMKVMAVTAIKIGFPSILAVWMPNLLFALVAIYLFRQAQK
jgi:lipopolysaccharide export system permease protein